jgi:hypothetical protein
MQECMQSETGRKISSNENLGLQVGAMRKAYASLGGKSKRKFSSP